MAQYELDEIVKIRLPFFLEMIAFIILPFEELFTLPGVGSALRIIQILVLMSAVYSNRVIRIDRYKDSTDIPLVLFYIYIVASVIWCFNRSLYVDRLITYTLYVFLIVALKNLIPNGKEIHGMIKSIYISGTLSSIVVIIGMRVGFLMNMGDRYTIMLYGRHTDPNVLACSMTLSFIICFYNMLKKKERITINVLSMIIQGYAIVILGSRSSLISLFAAITVIIIFMPYSGNRLIKRASVFILSGILVITMGTELASSTLGGRFSFENMIGKGELGSSNRFEIWGYAFSQFLRRPLFGYGNAASPYAIEQVYRFYATHNTTLMVLLEFGIFGFLLYFIWMLKLCKRLFRGDLLLFAFLICIFTQGIFLEQFSTKIFWCVMIVLHSCITGIEFADEYFGG